MYDDIAYLCTEEIKMDGYLNQTVELKTREVFVKRKSVTSSEFYRAATADFKPSRVLKLADRYDYAGEKIVKYDGILFNVIRAYETGTGIELVLEERIGTRED